MKLRYYKVLQAAPASIFFQIARKFQKIKGRISFTLFSMAFTMRIFTKFVNAQWH